MRKSLAVVPPKEILDIFRDFRAALSKYKTEIDFLEPQEITMHLHFLGTDISGYSYETMMHSLKSLFGQFYSFELELSKITIGLPFQRRPHVIYFNVAVNDEITKLHKHIYSTLRSLSLPDVNFHRVRMDKFYYFKLAVIKERVSKSVIKNIEDVIYKFPEPTTKTFKVSQINLVENYIDKRHFRSRILDTVKLK